MSDRVIVSSNFRQFSSGGQTAMADGALGPDPSSGKTSASTGPVKSGDKTEPFQVSDKTSGTGGPFQVSDKTSAATGPFHSSEVPSGEAVNHLPESVVVYRWDLIT
jgi:hypothetical protein